jgi:hypothetical protein
VTSYSRQRRRSGELRKVPSEQAGYGPGLWVLQRWDADKRLWFDVGDPMSEADAHERVWRQR